MKNNRSFTIIELMTVMGIMAILMSITLIAVNPARQFKKANDGKRQSDVVEILNAVNGYMANNLGSLPASFPTFVDDTNNNCISDGVEPPITAVEIGIGSGKYDLCSALTNFVPDYVASIPTDPDLPKTSDTCPTTTGYGIYACKGGRRVTVYSFKADLVPTIWMMK